MNRPPQDPREVEAICNHVLDKLGTIKPALSKELTKRLNAKKYEKLSKLKRKLTKIEFLIQQDRMLFEGIIAELNKSEYKYRESPLNCLDLIERMLPFLNSKGELSGGNYKDL